MRNLSKGCKPKQTNKAKLTKTANKAKSTTTTNTSKAAPKGKAPPRIPPVTIDYCAEALQASKQLSPQSQMEALTGLAEFQMLSNAGAKMMQEGTKMHNATCQAWAARAKNIKS